MTIRKIIAAIALAVAFRAHGQGPVATPTTLTELEQAKLTILQQQGTILQQQETILALQKQALPVQADSFIAAVNAAHPGYRFDTQSSKLVAVSPAPPAKQ